VTASVRSGTDISYRAAVPDDLAGCATIWRDALNDYMVRLGLPAIPDELGPIGRLHAHVHATDPDRFCVATRGDRLVGFASATVRDGVWFLSMLFVRPNEQGRGVGRALLSRILPPAGCGSVLATCTDSAQPISNGLYSRYGIVPRMPLLSLTGRPTRPDALERLPAGVSAVPFDRIAAGPPDGPGHRELVAAVDGLDVELAGFAHPQDHRFLRTEGRLGFLYRADDDRVLGYGYASAVGRLGPVAVRDEALLGPVLGHLLTVVEPRGSSAVWAPGHADRAIVALLRAGLRFDGFPVLVCWSAPFADFRRYLPISPGLL
jgi:GNAT superfamily N-acetyltransferase